ncbi:MAG TPA: hypothetical protein ENJ99_06190 [Rhizobiales bacterium]|nr:hypothetical protein [Hyphomicrobiales bacterium]
MFARIIPVLVCLFIAALPAQAKKTCEQLLANDASMFTTRDNPQMAASCMGNGVCLVTISAKDNRPAWLHLGRTVKSDQWVLRLQLLEAKADISEGIQVSFDGRDAENIPSEFLDVKNGGALVIFRNEIQQVLLDETKKAGKSRWSLVSSKGKKLQFDMSHSGLSNAIAWINCKVK